MIRCLLLWLSCLLPAGVGSQQLPAASPPAPETLTVYVRQGCPHCAAAEAYLATWRLAHPGLQLVYRTVDRDAAARDELVRVSQASGHWPPGVPTFAYRGRLLVGFDDAQRSGPKLDALLAPDPTAQPPETSADDSRAAPAPWGPSWLRAWGLPAFTLAVGLIDGFNPCATWVLLFLLSLLLHLRQRRRRALIAATFVAVSGAVYYAFMAAWLNLFLVVGWSEAIRVGLALLALLIATLNLKDYLVGTSGISLSIPAAAKPGLYTRMRSVLQASSLPLALLGVAALAVVVNFIELLCTAGLPAMYTAVLAQQQLSPAGHNAYLALYILGYVADDSLMVAAAV